MSDDGDGYYLRSKRRKLEVGEEATCSYHPTDSCKRKNPIQHLPMELLQHIFGYIPYYDLNEKVRLVNRRFRSAAEDVLNRGFKAIPKKIEALMSSTSEAIETSVDDMEIRCFCKLLNMLDLLMCQHTVIMGSIWRYVFNEVYSGSQTCMYGGMLLDAIEEFFQIFITCPYQLYAASIVKDYSMPKEVSNIIHLTKTFCIKFDQITEENHKSSLTFTGCKIIDLLDCAQYAKRTVISEKVVGNTFTAKYNYFLHNAWFTAFDIPPEKEQDANVSQRMMHMRIRRIILAHTEMFLEQTNYQREVMVRMGPEPVKRPNVVVYTGFGDVHDTFFYYGAMNDAAYMQKFHVHEQNEELMEDDDDLVLFEDAENMREFDEPLDDLFIVPHLGLDVDIRVECPVSYAPLSYVMDHSSTMKKKAHVSGKVAIDIWFNCPGAYYPRLKPLYNYQKETEIECDAINTT